MKKLLTDDLIWSYDRKLLNFKTTDDLTSAKEVVGQPEAMKALEFGLKIPHQGYNIFVTGLSGTGRMTTLKSLLDKVSKSSETPPDICFVENFKDYRKPSMIMLPPGKGKVFEECMKKFIENVKTTIPELFESKEYKEETQEILSGFAGEENTQLLQFEKLAASKGFKIVQTKGGDVVHTDILPVVNNQIIPVENLRSMAASGETDEKQVEVILKERNELLKKYTELAHLMEKKKEGLKDQLYDFNVSTIIPIVESFGNNVIKKIGKEVECYFQNLIEYFKDNLYELLNAIEKGDPLNEFTVNVVVNNAEKEGAPIIMETSPTVNNLFGTIDSEMDVKGRKFSTFSHVRAGSLIAANGGYLVVNANDIFQESKEVWVRLKRALKNKQVEIEKSGEDIFQTTSLKPQSVPISVKVIILGDEGLYYNLYSIDDEFKKIFKILCEFNPYISITENNIDSYLTVIKKICDEEKLLPFTKDAVYLLLRESVKFADDKTKLTARFHLIADIMREASFIATLRKGKFVEDEDIEKVLTDRTERHSLFEKQTLEQIEDGTVLIDVSGKEVGQVNGLTVYDYEFYSFGKPARITASTSIGSDGIINIEREVEMTGKIHDKGLLILSGYLQGKYGKDFPISINATLCFEQAYGGIDGDSASSTELYALISSLTEIPIRQDIAVTGSVNQKGEIQPIGGVNQKIEGFYKVCKLKGLTGTQGVMIPKQNIVNLNLNNEVVEAVKKGDFHIYAIRTIDEGLEILTGLKAGDFESEGTIHHLVYNALKDYAEKMKKFNE